MISKMIKIVDLKQSLIVAAENKNAQI